MSTTLLIVVGRGCTNSVEKLGALRRLRISAWQQNWVSAHFSTRGFTGWRRPSQPKCRADTHFVFRIFPGGSHGTNSGTRKRALHLQWQHRRGSNSVLARNVAVWNVAWQRVAVQWCPPVGSQGLPESIEWWFGPDQLFKVKLGSSHPYPCHWTSRNYHPAASGVAEVCEKPSSKLVWDLWRQLRATHWVWALQFSWRQGLGHQSCDFPLFGPSL